MITHQTPDTINKSLLHLFQILRLEVVGVVTHKYCKFKSDELMVEGLT